MKLISERRAITVSRLPWACVALGAAVGELGAMGLVMLDKDVTAGSVALASSVAIGLMSWYCIRRFGFRYDKLQDFP